MMTAHVAKAVSKFNHMFDDSATLSHEQLAVLITYGQLIQKHTDIFLDVNLRVKHLQNIIKR